MCDQTQSIYVDGDLVWVKLGPVWWPGAVKDVEKDGTASEVHAGLRHKPIATVKFFDEDSYEFVKSFEDIYHYNCKRKDEFIKKGLAKYRAGLNHMKKFPVDVVKVEELTNGNVNIIDDPKYAPPEKRILPVATPSKRKSEELVTPIKKIKSVKAHSARVMANQDFKFVCPFCDFGSDSAGPVGSHFRYTHSSYKIDYGPRNTPRQVQSAPALKRRPKVVKPKITVSETKVKNDSKTKVLAASPDVMDTPVRTASILLAEKSPRKPLPDLVAEWGDEDEEESIILGESAPNPAPVDSLQSETIDTSQKSIEMKENELQTPPAKDNVVKQSTEADKLLSCFDFDDDEDANFIGMSDANTYGRKLPRFSSEKDRTRLGMDLEIAKAFERKSELNSLQSTDGLPIKKRGRPPKRVDYPESDIESKETITPVKRTKKAAEPVMESLALSRMRRPAARKSYVNEEIRSIEPDQNLDIDNEKTEKDKQAYAEKSGRKHLKKALIEYEKSSEEDDSEADSDESENEQEASKTKAKDKAPPLGSRVDLGLCNDNTEGKHKENELSSPTVVRSPEPKISDAEEIIVSKPSRRKQDLKSLIGNDGLRERSPKKIPFISEDSGKCANVRPDVIDNIALKDNVDSNIEAQVESFLAETEVPVLPAIPLSTKSHQSTVVEYLNEDPTSSDAMAANAVKISPVKRWQQNIKTAIDSRPIVIATSPLKTALDSQPVLKPTSPLKAAVDSKPIVQQWRQEIQERINSTPTETSNKPQEPAPPMTSAPRVVKLVNKAPLAAKKGTYYVSRPKILGKSGLIKLVSAKPSTTVQSNSPKIVKLVQSNPSAPKLYVTSTGADGTAQKLIVTRKGKDVASPKYQILPNKSYDGSAQNVLLSAKSQSIGPGYRIVSNYNGTGKRLIQIRKQPTVLGENAVIKRSDVTTGQIVMQKPQKPVQFIVRNQLHIPSTSSELEPEVHSEPITAEPVEHEEEPVALPAPEVQPNTQQVLALDGQKFVLYFPQSLQNELYQHTPDEAVYPTSTPGQDILAEAIAITNGLESEMPMMQSVVQDSNATGNFQEPAYVLAAELPHVQSTPLVTDNETHKPIIEIPENLDPTPQPPTPEKSMITEEDGDLMIAEQNFIPVQSVPVEEQPAQEEEGAGTFESMPLLEESAATEEPIGDQSFQAQLQLAKSNEYLPSSTNPDLETEQDVADNSQEKDAAVPYVSDDGFMTHSQDTEVTSTTTMDNISS